MKNPKTEEEWQAAVDAANAFLILHSLKCYGLITGGPQVNAERCDEILRQGEARGVRPKMDPVQLLQSYNEEMNRK